MFWLGLILAVPVVLVLLSPKFLRVLFHGPFTSHGNSLFHNVNPDQ